MKRRTTIIRKTAGALGLPAVMFIVMLIFCHANGKNYFGSWAMWKTLIVDIAVSALCAMGIGLQFKSGRFDFSGGAIMLLTAILAGNLAKSNGNNLVLFMIVCLAASIILSVAVSLVYVYGRLPIVITTIGMALLYESLTSQLFGGGGINLVANMTLKRLSIFPGVLLPFIAGVAVYALYGHGTTTGKQAMLLANNQQAAVNIGINEKKNVIISYIFSGMIFGFATSIYASTAMRSASYSSLSTVGELFNNILPVFVGLLLASFCVDTIGILAGSVTICLMSYGLGAALSAEFGSALSIALTGVFVLVVNVIGGQGQNIQKLLCSIFKVKKQEV